MHVKAMEVRFPKSNIMFSNLTLKKNEINLHSTGGPLVCQDDGFFELAGLVSWGFGCGRIDVPGVYVKVSSFIGWINQIISVNNL